MRGRKPAFLSIAIATGCHEAVCSDGPADGKVPPPCQELKRWRQQGRSFHGCYDGYCYLPLYIYLCGLARNSRLQNTIGHEAHTGDMANWSASEKTMDPESLTKSDERA